MAWKCFTWCFCHQFTSESSWNQSGQWSVLVEIAYFSLPICRPIHRYASFQSSFHSRMSRMRREKISEWISNLEDLFPRSLFELEDALSGSSQPGWDSLGRTMALISTIFYRYFHSCEISEVILICCEVASSRFCSPASSATSCVCIIRVAQALRCDSYHLFPSPEIRKPKDMSESSGSLYCMLSQRGQHLLWSLAATRNVTLAKRKEGPPIQLAEGYSVKLHRIKMPILVFPAWPAYYLWGATWRSLLSYLRGGIEYGVPGSMDRQTHKSGTCGAFMMASSSPSL